MKSSLSLILVLAAGLGVGACASAQIGGGNTVSRNQVQQQAQVYTGTVIDAVEVTIEGTRSGAGAVGGAVAGAVVGSQIGGTSSDRAIAGTAGAIIGAVAGDAIEEGVTKQKGVTYTIRYDGSRETVQITQGLDPFMPRGTRVQVAIYPDGSAKVTPAPRGAGY